MLAGVVALWIVGGCLIGFALRFLRRLPHANGRFAATLISSHVNILSGLLRVVLVVAILGFFGLQTASFAALLAGAGVAVGIACGGRRFDFAAAVFLGVLPPILNGDFVEVADITGMGHEVAMFVSSPATPDPVCEIIANSSVFADVISTYANLPCHRVERVAQPDYSADVVKAIKPLREEIRDVPHRYSGKLVDVEALDFRER